MSNNKRNSAGLVRLVGIGIFAALSIVVSFATSFIKVGYLSLDAGDIVIVLASFIYGPLSGIVISAISSLFGFLYSGTGPWGLLMDFVSSAVFAFMASYIYSRRKNFSFAIIGIYSSVVVVTALMMPLNIIITPLYSGVTSEFVIKQIPVMLLPFNFAKSLFNGGAVLLLYKPLVRAMRSARLIPPSSLDTATATDDRSKQSSRTPDGTALSGAEINGDRSKHSSTVLALVIGGISVLLAVVGLVILAVLNIN